MTIQPNIVIIPTNLKGYINDFEINYETPKEKFIGTFISRTLDLKLANINMDVPNEIKLAIGIDNESPIPQPTFIITSAKLNEDSGEITLKGIDYSMKFDEYFDLNLSYPLTLGELANAISNKIGITIKNINFPNADYIMNCAKIDKKFTYREIIGMIASAMGGVAFINNNDELEFKNLTNTTLQINNPFEQITQTEKIGPINSVILTREPISDVIQLNDEISIEQNGKTEIKIVNNYLIDDNREGAIQAIYNSLYNFDFYSKQIETYQGYKLNPFDLITLNNKRILITNINIKYPLMLDGYIGNTQMTKNEIRYNTPKEIDKKIIDAEAKVNKVEGEINLLVQKTETNTSSIDNINDSIKLTDKFEKQTNVTINSAEANLFDVNLFEESRQETREGYNLLNYDTLTSKTINGITYTINDDKSITANGTATANSTLNLIGVGSNYPLNLEAGDYILSGCSGGSKNTYVLEIYNGTSYKANLDGSTLINFSEDTAIRVYIAIKSGVTVSNLKFYPMLIKGTEEKPYEQYGTMPSPEFPRFINSLKNINYKVTNKNKFDNREPLSNTIYKKEEDIYIFKVENIYDHLATRNTVLKEIKADTDYNIVLEILENTLTGTLSIMTINTIFENSPIAEILAKEKGKKIFTMHTRKDLDSALYDFWMAHSNAISGDFVCKIMITDSKDTTYQEHKEFTTTIELPEETELCNLLNGVQDYIDDTGLIHKKIKKLEIDSSLDILWSEPVVREKTCRFYIRSFDDMLQIQNNIVSYCTHFKGKYIYNVDEVGFYLNYSNTNYASIYFSLPKEIGTTVQEIKNWFDVQKNNGTPVTVYYELENEDTSKSLTDTEKKKLQNLKLFEGYNNITCNAYLSANYLRNTELNNIYENQVDSNRKYTEIQTDINGITNTVSETNSYIDNTIVSRIVKTEQSLDGLKISIGQTGGQNLIKNSTLKFGADKNVTTTGTVSVEEYSEISNNTISKSAIKINKGTVKFNPSNVEIGKPYTFSCLVNKLALANAYITITNVLDERIKITAKSEEFVEIQHTFTALSGQVQITLECDNNYCLFSDCMLSLGIEKKNWQLASGEISNKSVNITDDGAEFINSAVKTKLTIGANGTQIINTETNEVRAKFNDDDTLVNNLTVNGINRHGKLIHTDFGDHIVASWASN